MQSNSDRGVSTASNRHLALFFFSVKIDDIEPVLVMRKPNRRQPAIQEVPRQE